MANTPHRTLRIDDDTWTAALERSQQENTSLSVLMRGWLIDYAAGKSKVGPGRPATVTISRAELTKLRDLVERILA